MLSMVTKRQIINKQKPKYRKATKKGKTQILNALEETTGLTRGHLTLVLSGNYVYEKKIIKSGRGRKPVYGMPHKELLVEVWELLNYPSSRRLAASMEDVLDNLERRGHKTFEPKFKKEMVKLSHGTMDRLLKYNRKSLNLFGLSTTKPGSLLKNQIPIRRGTDWDDSRPGFVEIDLVAHCGSTTRGEYVNTLDCADISSGWTECYAIKNKARVHTLNAMKEIKKRLFFPLLGIDSDNGSEFINEHFFYYCKDNNLCFTRSRANHSNDSCYVEQKNWSVVRQNIGYERYEGDEAVDLLNQFYEKLRFVNNFFIPSQKLILKKRNGGKIYKKHDCATTPYRRLMLDPNVDELDKKALESTYLSLDLLQLREDMDKLLAKIKALSLR
ncbi:MAG: transposase family protein [Clostridiales bacterium]|nr:transposase family protein [Clostridiales bacterium]